MVEPTLMREAIALDDFLPIFISSALVLVFGAGYAGIFTLVKTGFVNRWFMPMAYMFWGLTAWMLYIMGSKMHMGEFTAKALLLAMLAYLIMPHVIYHMVHNVEEANETEGTTHSGQ